MAASLYLYPPQQVTVSTGTLATSANQTSEINLLTSLNNRLPGGLVPVRFDEQVLTYNGNGDVATVVYKLATVTVKTLTLSYNGSFQLTSVVAS
jgi:hypothetical protein